MSNEELASYKTIKPFKKATIEKSFLSMASSKSVKSLSYGVGAKKTKNNLGRSGSIPTLVKYGEIHKQGHVMNSTIRSSESMTKITQPKPMADL